MSNMDEMIEKFKKHDWFYEYLEDGGQWSAAAKKHSELIAEVRKLPMNQIPDLIERVPADQREKFMMEITRQPCGGL